MNIVRIISILVFSICLLTAAFYQPPLSDAVNYIDIFPNNEHWLTSIDWTWGVLTVRARVPVPEPIVNPSDPRYADPRYPSVRNYAQARLWAEQRARELVYCNMLEDVQKLPVTFNSKMNDYLLLNKNFQRLAQERISKLPLNDLRYERDDNNNNSITVIAELKLSLYGTDGLTGMMDPREPITWFLPFSTQKLPKIVIPEIVYSEAYPSIVIDARGLTVTPALAPNILDTHGTVIYRPEYVRPEAAITRGLVAYVKSSDFLSAAQRQAQNGIIVPALRTLPNNTTDLVIGEEWAQKIYSSPETQQALRNCMITIIIDD